MDYIWEYSVAFLLIILVDNCFGGGEAAPGLQGFSPGAQLMPNVVMSKIFV
jgi:hypothetical protein